MTTLAMDIGREMGLPQAEIDLLQRGGLLHDIGKIGVSTSILNKPGRLTAAEHAVFRSHPANGATILRPIRNLWKVLPIVSEHHERYDGKGCPDGLSGDSISLHARILAVADVADALVSERPYRSGWPREQAVQYLKENAGTQFDPKAVEALLRDEARRCRDDHEVRPPSPEHPRPGESPPVRAAGAGA